VLFADEGGHRFVMHTRRIGDDGSTHVKTEHRLSPPPRKPTPRPARSTS
jgi:hypothetical protein